jgi:RimJ/RimL family protein N-acetyltransferase
VTSQTFVELRQRLFELVPVDVLERDVDRPLPKLAPIPGLEIRRVADKQPAGWRELVPKSRWRVIERNLARGDVAHMATIEGDLAGMIWVSRRSHRDPWSGIHIRIAPDEAYTYAMEVDPPYRRLGVAAVVVAAMLSALQEEGRAKRAYGWVDSRNRKSQILLRVIFGFTQVQTVKRAHLLRRIGWQVRGSDRPPYGPVSRVGQHSEAESPVVRA